MHSLKRLFSTAAAIALVGSGALLATSTTASARIVCNQWGDCWHTDQRYHYVPDVQVQYHPDDWYFHRDWSHDNDHHWRDYHDGRGYYKNGVWVTF